MSKDRDFNGPESKNPASRDTDKTRDREGLWKKVVKDVRKLDHPEKTAASPPKISRRKKQDIEGQVFIPLPAGTGGANSGLIDRKTEDRVRKGLIQIEASLDLHGNTATTARRKLLQFILQSVSSGKRCVLVVTGKGPPRKDTDAWYETGGGVIKREFRLWLEDGSVKPHIMSISAAQPKHGGDGAFYVYLRKSKSTS